MIYQNINILATADKDIAVCKFVIDGWKQDNYELYETIGTMGVYKDYTYYTTCLHEQADKFILSLNGHDFPSIEAVCEYIDHTVLANVPVRIARHINNISLNDYEYVLNEDASIMVFSAGVQSAIDFLNKHNTGEKLTTEQQWNDDGVYFQPIVSEQVQAFDRVRGTKVYSACLCDDMEYGLFAVGKQYGYSTVVNNNSVSIFIHEANDTHSVFAEYNVNDLSEVEADMRTLAQYTGEDLLRINL